jgi:hypothetical protein
VAFRSKASPYEVRCAECDVSFPPETRVCVHCGRPTGTPSFFGESSGDLFDSMGSSAESSDSPFQVEHVEPSGHDPYSIGHAEDAGSTGSTGNVSAPSPRPTYEGEAEQSEGSESIGQSLLRSLGSVIWVVLLIGFSLYRSCGNE